MFAVGTEVVVKADTPASFRLHKGQEGEVVARKGPNVIFKFKGRSGTLTLRENDAKISIREK